MTLRINSEVPDFTADTTQGEIAFHDWIGDGWAILFSHPKDFTPVCTTELGYMAGLADDFAARNCKVIGLSVDPVGNHQAWLKDIEETQGNAVSYPLIGDPTLAVAKLFDMLPEDAGDTAEGRTPVDNAAAKATASPARTANSTARRCSCSMARTRSASSSRPATARCIWWTPRRRR